MTNDADALVERLRRRARTGNGTPVGAGDGDTYIPGSYTREDALLDTEAADRIAVLSDQPVAVKADLWSYKAQPQGMPEGVRFTYYTEQNPTTWKGVSDVQAFGRIRSALAAPPPVSLPAGVEALLDERQERAEHLHGLLIDAREIVRKKLTPADDRAVFDKLHAAIYVLSGDPFDLHMRAMLAAARPIPEAQGVEKPGWVLVPERYVIAVHEFLADWKKGDFSLSTLAAVDVQSIIAAKEAWAEALAAQPASDAAPTTEPVEAQGDVVAEIAAERQRQKDVEGWTEAHDDTHVDGEMAAAAACYAHASAKSPHSVYHLWPWSLDWFKQGNRRRNLVKAGALIVAEIERLDRLAAQPASDEAPATNRTIIDKALTAIRRGSWCEPEKGIEASPFPTTEPVEAQGDARIDMGTVDACLNAICNYHDAYHRLYEATRRYRPRITPQDEKGA